MSHNLIGGLTLLAFPEYHDKLLRNGVESWETFILLTNEDLQALDIESDYREAILLIKRVLELSRGGLLTTQPEGNTSDHSRARVLVQLGCYLKNAYQAPPTIRARRGNTEIIPNHIVMHPSNHRQLILYSQMSIWSLLRKSAVLPILQKKWDEHGKPCQQMKELSGQMRRTNGGENMGRPYVMISWQTIIKIYDVFEAL